MVPASQFAGLFAIARSGAQSIPFKIRFSQSCFCARLEGAGSSARACSGGAARGCGLAPAPTAPSSPHLAIRDQWREPAGLVGWLHGLPPSHLTGKKGGSRESEATNGSPLHHDTVYRELGQSTRASVAPLPVPSRCSPGRIAQAARPPQAARLHPGTHLLIRPACSCWRSRGGAAGGRCSSPVRPRPPRRPAPPLSSRPPACEAPGPDRWVSARAAPGGGGEAQNSFRRGNLSILKFLPGSCKTAALGKLPDMDTRMDRQTERRRGRQRKKGEERGMEGQRWRHTERVCLRSQKGQIPLFLHSWLSVFMQSVDSPVQTAGLLRTEGKQPQSPGRRARRRADPRAQGGR